MYFKMEWHNAPIVIKCNLFPLQLCGGGPLLSLWHLRSMSPTSVFPLPGCQREAVFHQDLVRRTSCQFNVTENAQFIYNYIYILIIYYVVVVYRSCQ